MEASKLSMSILILFVQMAHFLSSAIEKILSNYLIPINSIFFLRLLMASGAQVLVINAPSIAILGSILRLYSRVTQFVKSGMKKSGHQ
jgi:hypothetical protein